MQADWADEIKRDSFKQIAELSDQSERSWATQTDEWNFETPRVSDESAGYPKSLQRYDNELEVDIKQLEEVKSKSGRP